MPNPTVTYDVPATIDTEHRRCLLGDEPMILHCHHYSTFLQRSIQDASFVESGPFLVGAAAEVAHSQLSKVFADSAISELAERKAMAEAIFSWAGFGKVDLSELDEHGGSIESSNNHYSQAWKSKFGPSNQPVDKFTTGWLAGALAAIHDLPNGHYQAEQTRCSASGDSAASEFRLSPGPANYSVWQSVGSGQPGDEQPLPDLHDRVDYAGILAAFTDLQLVGNEEGLIPAFGVYLTRHYANYYNRISFEFERSIEERCGRPGLRVTAPLLIEAGHVCAFNTLGGIATSPEWDALVRPGLRTPEDWVHGIVAAVNTLGWGRWQVANVSDKEATFSIHDDYESIGYQAMYGHAEHNISYLAKGAAAGIMDLIYIGKISDWPELTPAFYNRLFKSGDSFQMEDLSGRAQGDEFTSFRIWQP